MVSTYSTYQLYPGLKRLQGVVTLPQMQTVVIAVQNTDCTEQDRHNGGLKVHMKYLKKRIHHETI